MHLFNIQPIIKILYTPIQLKFFSKSSTIKAMDRVDFIEKNEFHIKSRKLFGDPTTPTMITILLKTGLAKNEKQALVILIGIVVATLSLTAWLADSHFNPTTSNLVIDQVGNSYTFEEYIDLVRQGKDPLLPK